MNIQDAVSRYIEFFNNFSASDLDRFETYFQSNARFRDPFNDVRGIEAIRRIFAHMYKPCPKTRFIVHDHAISGMTAYLHWGFDCNKEMHIDGLTKVTFADDGRVIAHLDYWDPAAEIYEKLPLIGLLARALRRQLAVR